MQTASDRQIAQLPIRTTVCQRLPAKSVPTRGTVGSTVWKFFATILSQAKLTESKFA